MSEGQYGQITPERQSFQLQDQTNRRDSISLSSDDSDVSYRDNLDDEPFDEKDRRFEDERDMEDGEGYTTESRRVCRVLLLVGLRLTLVAT